MTISDADVTRFKKAFKGKVAERDTPLLAHKVKLPAAATSSDRVKKALSDLEAKLATMSSDATGKAQSSPLVGIRQSVVWPVTAANCSRRPRMPSWGSAVRWR